jgi:CelD/BcsL family acetyltransferase involved in cellulose biosynthesis
VGIARINPLVDPLWQQLVDRPGGSVFHSAEWLRVLADTYGFEVAALIALDDAGRPKAGIPYCRIADMLGERIATLPFSDYCDPLVENPDDWEHLMARLAAERLPITMRPLHNELPLSDERLTLARQAKWHGMDLRPDLDAHWSRLPDSAKRAIRKARDSGVAVRAAEGREELRTFFDMHLGIRKYKYRLLAQPYRFFESIWQQFMETGRGRLMLATYREQVIGGVLFLEWDDTLYYKFNASAPGDLPHRPNDLLMWEGIQYGKARGLDSMDLGLSDWDQEGLIRYKRKYATEEKAISFLKHTPPGCRAHQDGSARELLGQLTGLLTDKSVPDAVTDRAGELLYRFFA